MKSLVVVIWILLGVFYWWLDQNIDNRCCEQTAIEGSSSLTDIDPSESSVAELPQPDEKYPLVFRYNSADPQTSSRFEKFKDSILNNISDDQILVITGLRASDEFGRPSASYADLGKARAAAVQTLFSDRIDTSKVVIKSREIDQEFEAAGLAYHAVEFDSKRGRPAIVEIEDRTLIYFTYNSTQRMDDPEIEAYLRAVGDRVKSTGEIVELTGHTDSFGNASYNYALGLRRANVISRVLGDLGVPKDQIVVLSKGETDPIAPNNTAEGRSKNRRTELVIKEPVNN
ncbi:MAG: OmpA family protein [Saprospiraceae bacterium]|nr:OmpA family protein [Saprospiraceae bacterium]